MAPSHPNNKKLNTNIQKNTRETGRYDDDRTRDVEINGNNNNTKIEANKPITPNSLFGIPRKIA
jgi:hypothetical protein